MVKHTSLTLDWRTAIVPVRKANDMTRIEEDKLIAKINIGMLVFLGILVLVIIGEATYDYYSSQLKYFS